jgi:urease beta subunit
MRKAKAKRSRRKGARAVPAQGAQARKSAAAPPDDLIPGEILLGDGDVVAFHGRRTIELTVANTGDRPIQVGSHCHFFEVNRALRFNRAEAYGYRLQVPAGTAVRFEPGEEKLITLIAIGGNRVVYGINGLVGGKLDDARIKRHALDAADARGFMGKGKAT